MSGEQLKRIRSYQSYKKLAELLDSIATHGDESDCEAAYEAVGERHEGDHARALAAVCGMNYVDSKSWRAVLQRLAIAIRAHHEHGIKR